MQQSKYVLYWMQQSMRWRHNDALEHAAALANEHNLPLVVGFGLMDDYPEANLRHYVFLLEGLKEVEAQLAERNILFVLQKGQPDDVAIELGKDAAIIVCDRGYLRHQKMWRTQVAKKAKCQVLEVECDVVVPVEKASGKQESAARTLRPKIMKVYKEYLSLPAKVSLKNSSLNLNIKKESLADPLALAKSLKLEQQVGPVSHLFPGGQSEAEKTFRLFLSKLLQDYAANRNQPQTSFVSHMSKFLHFGMVSPVWLVNEVEKHGNDENVKGFVEELVVRRELAMNFCYFNEGYDRFEDAVPEWAQATLQQHVHDERQPKYSLKQMEDAATADPYWNASMEEMIHTGYMHNYMRMYWGKKILEWSPDPKEAHRRLLYLNNKYFLDGRDCNSFSNAAWIFGNHDRPWGERAIYGKVRSMMASGLERKTKPKEYITKVARLKKQATQME